MGKTGETKLTSVGKLVKELNVIGTERPEYIITIWEQDNNNINFGVSGIELDERGDVCIYIEDAEWCEEQYNVIELLHCLEGYDKTAMVYLAGEGLYLCFEHNGDGSVFCDPNDENDTIGCYTSAFGEYEVKQPSDYVTPEEKAREDHKLSYILVIIMLGALAWLVYNIYLLITGAGGFLWEKVLWIISCSIVLVVGWFTLYYSKK